MIAMITLRIMLLSALAFCCAACKGGKEAVKAEAGAALTAAPVSGESLFWQVKREGVEKPSWIFGTIHVIGADDYYLGSLLREALEASDRLVLEVDLDQIDMAAMAMSGLLPENKTVRDYLSESDYDLVATVLSDSIGMSRSAFEGAYSRMKPIFLQQLVIYKFLGGNPVSYESNLHRIASENGVELLGLETFAEQLAFLDQIPLDEQFSDLVESLRDWRQTQSQFQELLEAYKNQDIKALNHLIEDEMENPKMRELLLDKRNHDWMPKLREWIDAGNSFIAVGAGHLGGGQGILNKLREAGYILVPVDQGPHTD